MIHFVFVTENKVDYFLGYIYTQNLHIMFDPSTIKFLQQLGKNNNKEWFDIHRSEYENARGEFLRFIGTIIKQHGLSDPDISMLEPKSCVFRINRDVRFSKNKAPYKTNMGASMVRGGKKSIYAGYYFHMEPGASFVGGGLWMPEPNNLRKVRQEIEYSFDEFKGLVNDKSFKSVFGKLDDDKEFKLVRAPKGYEEDSPAIEYLKLKSLVAMAPIADDMLTSKALTKTVLNAFKTIQPLLNFINRGLDD